jgi:hypothetical protein
MRWAGAHDRDACSDIGQSGPFTGASDASDQWVSSETPHKLVQKRPDAVITAAIKLLPM